MTLFICVLVFMTVFILVAALLVGGDVVRVDGRLQQVEREQAQAFGVTELEATLSSGIVRRLGMPVLHKLREGALGLAPATWVENTRKRLDRAGPPYRGPADLLMFKALSLVLGLGAAYFALFVWHAPLLHRCGAAVCLTIIGLLTPDYMLDTRIRNRQARIRRSLPDAVDLLVASAEAGTGLDGALSVVVDRKTGPLSEEFYRLLTEIRLGRNRDQAWNDMGKRVNLQDLDMLIIALQQAQRLGVSIAQTLRNQADAMRTRRSLEIRKLVATLALRMLFPLVFCVFPSLFVVILAPGAIAIARAFGIMAE